MKTKVTIKKEVSRLAKRLKELSVSEIKASQKKLFDSDYAVIFNRKHHCLQCFHVWKEESSSSPQKKTKRLSCPCCNRKLKVYQHSCFDYTEYGYVDKLELVEGYQVYRLFSVIKHYDRKRTSPHTIQHSEVLQYWCDLESGKFVFNVKPRRQTMGTMYFDLWDYSKPMAIRDDMNHNLATLRGFFRLKTVVSERLLRCGFSSSILSSSRFFEITSTMLSTPIVETLYKIPSYGLFDEFINNSLRAKQIKKYWNSIKIAHRHGKRDFTSDWFDYLELLDYFKKDLNSPALLIPGSFKQAHNLYVNRKRKIMEKEAEERRKLRLEEELAREKENQENFIKNKSQFFGLSFNNKELGIIIEPLKSIDEFKQHTDKLNHCVWTNAYFNRINSLVLGAMVNGELLETIEFDLVNFEVLQARGMNNDPSEYNEEIIHLMNSNVSQIQSLVA